MKPQMSDYIELAKNELVAISQNYVFLRNKRTEMIKDLEHSKRRLVLLQQLLEMDGIIVELPWNELSK